MRPAASPHVGLLPVSCALELRVLFCVLRGPIMPALRDFVAVRFRRSHVLNSNAKSAALPRPTPPRGVPGPKLTSKAHTAGQVDERVRNGGKGVGEHCDLWVRQAEQVAASQKTQCEFVPTKSNTPLEVYVTVHLKAKNLKRLLTKVGVLADVCLQRSIQGSGNYDVYTDGTKGHVKGDFELKMAPEQMASVRRSANGLGDGGGWATNAINGAPGKLPALVPIESGSVKRNKVL